MSTVCLTTGGNLQTFLYHCFPCASQQQHVTYLKADPKSHPNFALKFNFFPRIKFLTSGYVKLRASVLSSSVPYDTTFYFGHKREEEINPLSPELNPICYLLALLGAHHFLHVSRIRVKLLIFRLLMSYVYGTPILDVSRSHTTTQYSR